MITDCYAQRVKFHEMKAKVIKAVLNIYIPLLIVGMHM